MLIPETEQSEVTSVFISHAVEDSSFTDRLLDDLRTQGFSAQTFRDLLPVGTVLPTDRLHAELVEAIENASFFLPVLSPASVGSKWVNIEVENAIRSEARKHEIGLIPILARECSRPEILGLRTPSDFTQSYERGFEDLIARLSAPKTHLEPKTQQQDPTFNASEAAANKLRNYLAENPERISALSPQQFENLVADMFRRNFNLEVEAQSASRDGGVDIIVLGGRDVQQTPILVQCKRYAPGKRVGVEVVRSLFGAMAQQGVNRGMLVTTSSFTRGAIEMVKRVGEISRDRLSLPTRRYDSLVAWLAQAPGLGPDITAPVRQIHQRYLALVDKKFTSQLSVSEEIEIQQLVHALDEADASFYEPLKAALTRERDRLLENRSPKTPKES